MTTSPQALIVHAHPEPTSFSAALKDTAVQALEDAGCAVTVSDLYAERFDPVAGRHDFVTARDSDRFHYQSEQLHAWETGGYSAEIAREQARVDEADLMILTFPLWWGGVPAILKGWFDRVLSYGFAYRDGRRFESGYLRGRSAILGVVTGGTPKRFSAGGTYGPIEEVLWPTQHCMIEYLGLKVAEPFVAYAAPRISDAARREYLRSWTEVMRRLAKDRVAAGPQGAIERTDSSTTWTS